MFASATLTTKEFFSLPCTISKKWAHFFVCFLSSFVCLMVTLAIFGIRYQLNDDAIISNIASGAYGPDTQYLVYVNVLFGFFLKPFYALVPSLNWFAIFLVAGAVFCFSILGYLWLQKFSGFSGFLLFILFLTMAGTEFFQVFHYVKYATLFLVTGLVIIALRMGTWSLSLFGGIAIALWGSMLRFQQFMGIGGLAAGLLILYFFHLESSRRKRAFLAVALFILFAFALRGIDTLAYRSVPEWQAFASFNTLRTEICDFRLQFATHDVLAELGYSPTDFEMLQTWNFYDSAVFSSSQLSQIVDSLPHNTFGQALKAAILAGFKLLYGSTLSLLFSASLAAWLFFSHKKKQWYGPLITLLVLAVELFYLHWRGRFPHTISFSLAFACLIFVAFCWQEPPALSTRSTALFASVLLLGSIPFYISMRDQSQAYQENKPPRAVDFDSISADKQTLYLVDAQLVDAANGYDVWHARPKDYFSNMVFTGSWLMQSPFEQSSLISFQMDNLYEDSINRDDVLYLETVYRALKEDYLQEHYDPSISLERVEEYEVFSSYRAITSTE